MRTLDNQKILVTGGTGSFSKKFVNYVLKNFKPKKLIIFSRDELKQYEMQNQLKSFKRSLRFFLGDVRDLDRLHLAMRDVDLVVHAAALKHVESGEYNPFEVVKTNVLGTQNIIDAIVNSNVKKGVFLSTDKAVSPINLYGATKLAAEKIFIAANNYSLKKFSVVKYGNVFNSRGSVLPFFIKQIKNNEAITITDKKMTRFNISLETGVKFVISSMLNMEGGETFIPKMDTIKIMDLITILKPSKGFKEIGIKPGEKIHEELISVSDNSIKIETKNYFVILPSTVNKKDKIVKSIIKKNKGKLVYKNFSYNSNDAGERLSLNNIKKLIKENYNI